MLAERSRSTAALRGGNARAAANAAAPQSRGGTWAEHTFALEADRLEARLKPAPGRCEPGFVTGFQPGFRIPPEPRPVRAGALVWFLTSHPLRVSEVKNQTRNGIGNGNCYE